MAGERPNPIPVILVDQSDDPVVDDANDAVRVYIVASDISNSGGTSAADDADFVAGTTSGTPVMGVYESSPSSVTEGDMGVVGITQTRALRVNVDNAGSIGGGTQYTQGDTDATITGTAMLMEGAGDALVPVQGTATDGVLVNLGTNNDVGLNAGTNNIGDVDVLTVPTDPFGANADAAATAGSTGSIQAKLRLMTSQLDSIKTAVETLDNVVGGSEAQVDVVGALPAGTNAIGKLAANSGVDIGDVDVTSIAAGSNLIGDVGIQPRTANGFTTFMASGSDGSSILVATAQVIKASAGKLYGYYIYNPEAAVSFVHFYNTAAASVTVGTTNPLFTLAIPAGAAANLMSDIGITFSNAGWSCAATTTAGGNTAPSTGVSLVAWYA